MKRAQKPLARPVTSASEPFVGKTMAVAAAKRHEVGPNGRRTAKAGELVEAHYIDGENFGAVARRVFVLLLIKAAGDAWKDQWFSIQKSDLRGAHRGNERINNVMDELARTLLRVTTKTSFGQDAVQTGAVVSDYRTETADGDTSLIEWRFSETMREVARRSDHYAILDEQIVLALRSSYTIALYEQGAMLFGRKHPFWRGTVAELRGMLGMPDSYQFTDIKRRALDPAKEQLDKLAPFTTTWRPFGHRRAVKGIEITFTKKDCFTLLSTETGEQPRPAVKQKKAASSPRRALNL
jgi:hypothetical protein